MEALLDRPLTEVPIVVIDTETTGLYPGLGHRITELGGVRLEGGKQVATLSQLINPERPLEPRAIEVSGITDEMVADAPLFKEVAPALLALVEGAVLVAHNAMFDASFVGMELFITRSVTLRPRMAILPNPWLCTLELARRHFYFDQNNLSNLAFRLGVPPARAHRALNDAQVTAAVFKRMVRELAERRMYTVGDYLHAQGGQIYTAPPPEPFLPEPLAEAMAANAQVEILYLGSAGESRRRVTPLYAAEHKGEGYLIAHCHLRNARRLFRVDRIFNVELV